MKHLVPNMERKCAAVNLYINFKFSFTKFANSLFVVQRKKGCGPQHEEINEIMLENFMKLFKCLVMGHKTEHKLANGKKKCN